MKISRDEPDEESDESAREMPMTSVMGEGHS